MPPGSKYEILDPGHGFAFENGKLTFRCQCSTFFDCAFYVTQAGRPFLSNKRHEWLELS